MDEMDTWPTLAAAQYEQSKKRVPIWQVIVLVALIVLLAWALASGTIRVG